MSKATQEVIIPLSDEARSVAHRLQLALELGSSGRGVRPQLHGEISFPNVILYRHRSAFPLDVYPRFVGSFVERDGKSVLHGGFESSAGAQLALGATTAWTVVVALVALALTAGTRSRPIIIVGLAFAALCGAFLWGVRWAANLGSRSEREMLINELEAVVRRRDS